VLIQVLYQLLIASGAVSGTDRLWCDRRGDRAGGWGGLHGRSGELRLSQKAAEAGHQLPLR
jgi:hypothetical protein